MTTGVAGAGTGGEHEAGQVRQAVVAAAVQEMAVRGVEASTSVAIASRAGLHPHLVDELFPSREDLLGAVLAQLAGEIAAAFDRDGLAALSGPTVGRYGRVIARAMLDGYDVAALQGTHPVMDRVLPVAIGLSNLSETETRVLVARQMALQFGWLLFEPFIAASVGLDDEALAWARDTNAPYWGMFAAPDDPAPA